MNGLPYYKAYPRDFFEGTIGMPLEVKGPYRLVLDLIYMQGGRLPDDSGYISGLLGCSPRQWIAVRQKILATGKIVASDGYLANNRADIEIDKLKLFQSKQQANAAQPKKNKHIAEATAKPRHSHTEPEPDTEIDKSISILSDFDQFWSEVPRKEAKGKARTAYRAARKKADAATLLQGIRRYAENCSGKDPQYIAHPATWLNGERWNDETPKTGGTIGQPNDRLAAMLRAAASPVDSWTDSNPSQPLLARQ